MPFARDPIRRTVYSVIIIIAILFAAHFIRATIQSSMPPVDPAWQEQAGRVQILRDEWGIAHVYGQSDADAAFGLAYAHAEDDFALIQGALIAAQGKLSLLQLSEKALANDFYTDLFGIQIDTDTYYDTVLSDDTRAMLEGYAAGFNYYASLHPDEADGRFFPITGKDIAAGFAHKLPLFLRIDLSLKTIMESEDPLMPGTVLPGSLETARLRMVASNAHAVHAGHSTDGITRLNVNSHQPWEGPVAWYEAHVISEEGWNMLGGTFPGSPIIFVGHNEHLGWAHTVNHYDSVDVYRLEMNPDNPLQYRVDDEWLELKERPIEITVDLFLFNFTYDDMAYTSIYGPTVKTDHGYYAFRHAGLGDMLRTVEQWYRMNKAANFNEWQNAMRLHALPMFNTVYADRNTIHYVYNARLPIRNPDYDWRAVLPGNTRKTLWETELPYDQLPQVTNPPSGFVQNCNSTPFRTTTGNANPRREDYPESMGIEDRMTNRALRSLELFGGDQRISRAEFLRYKWDRAYDSQAPIYREAITPVLENLTPQNETERRALGILRQWNGRTDPDNRSAALAILTWQPIWTSIVVDRALEHPDPLDTFRAAVDWLLSKYGRVDVPLGQVQRLIRGNVNLPLGGGPDVLNAIHARKDGSILRGWAGDAYIQIAEFGPDGVQSLAIHQYGNSSRADSPHYSDQAPLFSHRTLRRSLYDRADIEERLESGYHPGAEHPR
ncbi:MAG: penicillin acylase family protein [Leptospiraceae bacterium]|nr:penicillin acylase family protein [Leptospiraceae bacterium]